MKPNLLSHIDYRDGYEELWEDAYGYFLKIIRGSISIACLRVRAGYETPFLEAFGVIE